MLLLGRGRWRGGGRSRVVWRGVAVGEGVCLGLELAGEGMGG